MSLRPRFFGSSCIFSDGCRLMNRLLKAAGMPTVLYRTKAPSSFVALSNIESFVAAAKAFGVPETSLFQPSDLVDGRKGPLLYVLNCLNQLGIIVCRLYISHSFYPRDALTPCYDAIRKAILTCAQKLT